LLINPLDNVISKDHRRHELQAAEEAIRDLIKSEISVIACMTPASHLILDSNKEWDNVFDPIRIPPPNPERLPKALMQMSIDFTEHYSGIKFTLDGLEKIAQSAERLRPNQPEPRRSVLLMDELCGQARIANPPIFEINADTVDYLLQLGSSDTVKLLNDPNEIYESLKNSILGQEEVLRPMSAVIATRLGRWADKKRPRGVFLFGGPTGVGKTETAVQLASILSGNINNLIRINCNTLQPTGHQKTSVIWPLLGVPPGFVGHGEGGILTQIKEKPNAVVLFDEFEKADPAVGKLLLQIIDTGLQEDNMGNTLDFRQAFIIFTSNLGVNYKKEAPKVGFSAETETKPPTPVVEEDALRAELKLMGYGPEFLARVHKIFLYKSLTEDAIIQILEKHLDNLKILLLSQGYSLVPERDFAKKMAETYDPQDGVRGIVNRLRTEITSRLSLADREGLMKDVSAVSLRFVTKESSDQREYERDGEIITVYLW
ncbi:MAG: hypothetical protein CMK59_09105, partial [Proteobacteria bacterium]|nr:hypothetical protein [Pseudomonadota bacterium]